LAALLLCGILQGCAALANPVANGIPVRKVPPELLGESRQNLEATPLSMLRQKPPKEYRLEPGDILGVWVEGVLGEQGQSPPLRLPESGNLQPSLGFPIPVRGDGTIALPLIEPIKVKGKTLEQVQAALRKAYTVTRKILKPGQERIIVTLQQPRRYHILVIRQDSALGGVAPTGASTPSSRGASFTIGVGGGGGPATSRGTGFAIDLPAYENDLLNALARTGGFPGTDARNEVIIERGAFSGAQGRAGVMTDLQACPPGKDLLDSLGRGGQRIRIPLRYRRGQPPQIRPADIILRDGDIIYIESREAEVFYTAGLLPPGEYPLPRDVDLDVVEALVRVGGILNSGGVSAINLTGSTLTGNAFGIPSPSLVTVIRKTPGYGQVAIRVDLNRALRDRRERILIQPKDLIILQERPEEAFARYMAQTFRFNFAYTLISNRHVTATETGGPIP
jgi:protein involved in polysaccharide export with SLBB domain